MLIEHYDLEVFTPPCDPGSERFAATARLTTDISGVFPYLNATLRGAGGLSAGADRPPPPPPVPPPVRGFFPPPHAPGGGGGGPGGRHPLCREKGGWPPPNTPAP